VRRVPRISLKKVPGGWLAAALIAGTVGLLVPGFSHGTSTLSTLAAQAAPSAQTAAAITGCRGVTPAVFPAAGFVTDPARTQGGHLWWRNTLSGTCIGTVVEFVQYNATATKTWRVTVYSADHPEGLVVASRTFTLARGWYFWGFGVHQAFTGLSAVCLTASDSFGTSCLHFPH
jgi:hypothetical protein